MGLHLSNNFHVSSTSKRLLKEMPNSTLCLTPLSSSQGLQTLGLPEHAHFFSTQPAINGAKQGTQISMRTGKERQNRQNPHFNQKFLQNIHVLKLSSGMPCYRQSNLNNNNNNFIELEFHLKFFKELDFFTKIQFLENRISE